MDFKKFDYIMSLKALFIWGISSAACVFIFAAVMYFLESGYEYSPLFATVSLGVGCFFASWFLGRKIGKKGIVIGLLVGSAVFIVATLITLIVNSGGLSIHSLLRFIIFLLSSMIGAIIGVNQNGNKKYI
ncbi:MAG: TIGR04086 family membrane protein [Ruminococcaceae bacterium]|nr:TIGR04086 family membrane protein [Oscillospiraceae bacterium]